MAVLAFCQAGLFVGFAEAAPGDLDPSFGGDGRVLTDAGLNETARGVAVQADGKIIAAGPTGPMLGGLARYLPDGSLDLGFDGDGRAAAAIVPRDAVIQPDGKIVIAGRAFPAGGSPTGDFAVARYHSNGSLDTAFGSGGVAVTQFPPSGELTSLTGFANRVLIQGDGKILAGGLTAATSEQGFQTVLTSALALARYHPNGSLDTSFGNAGKQVVPAGRDYTPAESGLARQADGKIVLATTSSDGDFLLVRLTADGKFLDLGFNGSGIIRTNLFTSSAGESHDSANDVAIQSGKIVAAGTTRGPGGVRSNFALVRYTAAGGLDASFDGDGKLVTDLGAPDASDLTPDDQVNRVVVQPGGKIIAAGCTSSAEGCAGTGDFALVAYNPNGSLDTSFGAGGKVITPFGPGLDAANDVELQPTDGKLVAAGQAFNGANDDFALARYFAPLPLTGSPVAAARATDTTRPILSSLRISPKRFRAARSGRAISSTRVGARVSYRLFEAASVKFRVERALPGRRVRGRCVTPRRFNRTKRRCTRYKLRRGSFTRRGRQGQNSFRFRGRLRGRKLRPARYRLRAVAIDPAKNRSARKRVRFRIVGR